MSIEETNSTLSTDELAILACRLLLEDGVECECGKVNICARCAAQAAIAHDRNATPGETIGPQNPAKPDGGSSMPRELLNRSEITDLCEDCDKRPITGLDALCDACRENANERAYDRSMEDPTYRGGEYASAVAEEQAWIQRNLK